MATFGEVAEHLRRATVQVLSEGPQRGGGSGIIWRTDGLILTNAHVARSHRPVVELWDGRRLDARVAVADPRRDLAALHVAADGLPAATAGDSDRLRPGELVIAVGELAYGWRPETPADRLPMRTVTSSASIRP